MLSRAREKGLDGDELAALGEREGLPELVAAGAFLEQYLTILDDRGAVDYADLIRRATIEATVHRDGAARGVRARVRRRVPGHRLRPGRPAARDRRGRPRPGGGGRPAPVDLRVPRRRGARHPRLPDATSRTPTAARPDVVALGTTRRFGPRILTAAQRVAERIGLPGSIPEAARAAFLEPRAEVGRARRRPGRRPHLRQRPGRGRAPRRPAPARAPRGRHRLGRDGGAGALRPPEHPAAAALARRGRRARRGGERRGPAGPRPRRAAADRRDARRAQPRQRTIPTTSTTSTPPGPRRCSPVRSAGSTRATYAAWPGSCASARRPHAAETDRQPRPLPRAGPPGACSTRRCSTASRDRRPTAPARWPAWSRAPAPSSRTAPPPRSCSGRSGPAPRWPARLRRSVEYGGGTARRAHRDLDSICALFEAAARAEETRDKVGAREFLATLVAQQIPADTLAERGARGAAVRLLTAHRAKGLEWRLVVVAHVQQDGWPDLRRRSTLLGADRIGHDGLVPATSPREMLIEERRLFYVACTRARERLVVTAVESPEDDGDQPSRFLRRARRHRRGRRGPARAHALARRAGQRAAPYDRRPRRQPGPARRRGAPAGPAGRRVDGRPGAGAAGRPLDLVGHPGGDPVGAAAARPGPAGAGLGQPARRHHHLPDAVVPVPRGRRRHPPAPVGQPRRDRARARPADRRGRARGHRRRRRRRAADGARRRGLGPDGVPHPVGPRPRARADPRRARPVPGLARRRPARR